MIIAVVIAIGVLNVVAIPQFARIFRRVHIALPLPTRVVIGMSDFSVAYWPTVIAPVVASAFAVRSWVATERGTYQWDKRKLKIPVVGDVI